MQRSLLVVLASLCLLAAPARAHAQEDAEGCKDPSLVKRLPGAVLTECESKDFDEQEFALGYDVDGNAKTKKLEGKVERLVYGYDPKASVLEVTRNYSNALKKVGFATVYGDKGLLTVKLVKGSSETWVGVNTWNNGGALRTDLVILQVQAMQQKIEADAGAWLESLNATGRVAVYGINFDSNKSVIRPDSEQVLAEILKLLQDNPDLKLKVEGHTDNVGKAKANLQLSKERAVAVKAWLVKHGVVSARVTTDGLGDSKPVDDNSTEDGRAKNRRVELVKI